MTSDADQLRSFLAATDAPCPNCNYNLRGLTSDSCPECNQRLTLRVGLVEPRLGPLIAAASGLLAGAGAGFVCLILVLLFTLRYGPPSRREAFAVFVLPILCLVIQGTLALLRLRSRGRQWFRLQSGEVRAAVIALGWILTAVAVLVFFASVR